MAFSHLQTPEHTDRCVCDHFIQENCYITNDTDMIVVGNCCIKKFVNKSGRTCDKCGEPHKNRVVNRCNLCRQGCCDSCGRNINSRYKNCYRCRRGGDIIINPEIRAERDRILLSLDPHLLSSRERIERNMAALRKIVNGVAVVV